MVSRRKEALGVLDLPAFGELVQRSRSMHVTILGQRSPDLPLAVSRGLMGKL